MPERTEVTAGAIARLAGVGPAAVSNWRRRHEDFPRPVGGSATSPTFDLDAVEAWLRAQGKLSQVPPRERLWQQIEQDPAGPATALLRFGEALRRTGGAADWDSPAEAFEFLLGRHVEAVARQYALTPDEPAALMAELGGPAATVTDPACGFGALLLAAHALSPEAELRGQEAEPELAALAGLRLALAGAPRVDVRLGDSLRADAFGRPPAAPGADVVLLHPPFNERHWGHEELGYDPRWEYGLPPRTESELAWVQHALAHARPGGTVVVLMPPAAASRRSGRRVRADLLRRGALRAVIALPAGAAPPYNLPLHLWVLRRPVAPATGLLLVETAGLPWAEARAVALDAWRAVDADGAAVTRGAAGGSGAGPGAAGRSAAGAEVPGRARVVPVVELLDEEVDLTPGRHLPPASPQSEDGEGLDALRERLTAALAGAAALPARATAGSGAQSRVGTDAPSVATAAGPGVAVALGVTVTVAELVRSGAVELLAAAGPEEAPVRTRVGDVLLPVHGAGAGTGQDAPVARVVGEAEAGAVLERGSQLLRPDAEALDPWFLAGFLRGSANSRQASSFRSTATRLDARRLQLPRLPLAEQRRYGRAFRSVAAFEDGLREAARLGERYAQGLVDGLAEGRVAPD